MKQRPKVGMCWKCGKPMKKHTVNIFQSTKVPPKSENGRPILKVTKIYKFLGHNGYCISVWLGDYGYEGNSFFCSQYCGYRHGLFEAKSKY